MKKIIFLLLTFLLVSCYVTVDQEDFKRANIFCEEYGGMETMQVSYNSRFSNCKCNDSTKIRFILTKYK